MKHNIENCHTGEIPVWLVLLDNIPTLILFILGFLIISGLSIIAAVAYIIYAFLSIIWFWAKICPYCHQYDTRACPCGYGKISAKLFKRKDPGQFRKIFRKNIITQYPNWFIPSGVAIYLLLTNYSKTLLLLSLFFGLTGFAVIPLISRLSGCKNCKIKDDCPWMSADKNC